MDIHQTVRPSPIAGRWYPGETDKLINSIDQYLEKATLPDISGEVIAVMVPHAGHMYSGQVAAHGFKAIQGKSPDLVAVISPMHHPYPYPLLTSLHRAYWTPLGEIQIDHAAVQALNLALKERIDIELTSIGHDPEHSLEIELPFLQRVLSEPFQLLPVMVREQTKFISRTLGDSLAAVLKGKNALIVASTDLSHFYVQQDAERLDGELLRRVASFDPDSVLNADEDGKAFACGRGAVAAVMLAARALGADEAIILRYATSGDVTGDLSQVVGYGAAAFISSA